MARATIVIHVKKGVVQEVWADRNVSVILIDHDTDDGPRYMEADVSTGAVQMIEDEIR
jgi:hypothetical protein